MTEYMGPEDQTRFSGLLRERRLRLLRPIGASAAADAAAEEVKALEKALHRLAAAEYGWCDLCGAEMGYALLERHLTAISCADCHGLEGDRPGS
ncbi:hypothetical protein GCM10010449_81870 [Streptomyces rectiviolaceus]|uniref:DksA C4-type domain-containing protein n=1 Tax=Streptomyces rectiviolaceus TaxID=332591 RepID=A0ABP6NMG8_9ACTN